MTFHSPFNDFLLEETGYIIQDVDGSRIIVGVEATGGASTPFITGQAGPIQLVFQGHVR